MNLRQKAKRFKRLYEEKIRQPYPVVFKTTKELKHYNVCRILTEDEFFNMRRTSDLLVARIENDILNELKPIIKENIKQETDFYTGQLKYTVNIWL